MDRMGYHHEYRRAKVPKLQREAERQAMRESLGARGINVDDEMEEDNDDEDDDEDDYNEEERCWPSTAQHAEDYFGFMLDSGDHRLCERSSMFLIVVY